MALIGIPSVVLAFGSYQDAFDALYPTAGALVGNCGICHQGGGPGNGGQPRNGYGLAFAALPHTGASTPLAITKIEPLDSDRDTFTNLTEISGKTNPGDTAAKPVKILFVDNFRNGTAAGAPGWLKAGGIWSGTGQMLASSELRVDRILANPPVGNGALTFSSGVIQTKFNLNTTAVPNPNASIMFGFVSPTQYRFVKVTTKQVSIGQVGTMGNDTAGTKVTRPVNLPLDTVHTMKVVITPLGKVSVFINGAKAAAATFTFTANATGKIGLQAARSKTQFDDFFSSK
jgi:hypothetical protein